MQDIVLSTSPIMSNSRHQTASTPNSEHTKAPKPEDEIHTGFYTSASIPETASTALAAGNYTTYNQRTNNFSVSNLANLESTMLSNQQQHSWSAYPQYTKSNVGTFNQYQQYQTYQDLPAASSNFYLRLPQQTSPQPMGTTNKMESISAPSYSSYNQLSSSQISSSSFNTSQSSSKSLSPKLNANEFPTSALVSSSSSSCNQQMFTVPQQQTSPLSSSLGNLSSSSNSTGYNGNNQHGQQLNPIAVNTAPSSTNSSTSLPASSAESFEWMKPVKSQPNGNYFYFFSLIQEF